MHVILLVGCLSFSYFPPSPSLTRTALAPQIKATSTVDQSDLPPNWRRVKDANKDRFYYYNRKTKEVRRQPFGVPRFGSVTFTYPLPLLLLLSADVVEETKPRRDPALTVEAAPLAMNNRDCKFQALVVHTDGIAFAL